MAAWDRGKEVLDPKEYQETLGMMKILCMVIGKTVA